MLTRPGCYSAISNSFIHRNEVLFIRSFHKGAVNGSSNTKNENTSQDNICWFLLFHSFFAVRSVALLLKMKTELCFLMNVNEFQIT